MYPTLWSITTHLFDLSSMKNLGALGRATRCAYKGQREKERDSTQVCRGNTQAGHRVNVPYVASSSSSFSSSGTSVLFHTPVKSIPILARQAPLRLDARHMPTDMPTHNSTSTLKDVRAPPL